VRGILVTEGSGDGGTLKNTNGERFMFNYIPSSSRERPRTARKRRPLVRGQEEQPPHPDLLPPTSRAGDQLEVKAGRARPRRVFLDICTRRDADYIRKRLPSMYHQFKELAGVDITKEPMEVVPPATTDGRGEGRRDSTAARCRTLRGRRGRGRHARQQRLGGNSSATSWCSAGAGLHAALYAKPGRRPQGGRGQVEQIARQMLEPFTRTGGENPYTSSPTCRRRCRTWSGSSGWKPS